MRVVAIVPVLNEAASIVRCLEPLLAEADQVIVVDGGSEDASTALAAAAGARVLRTHRGRATQMNAGADAADAGDAGDAAAGAGPEAAPHALVFVHADTRMPDGWRRALEAGLAGSRAHWGRFDVRLDSGRRLLRVVGGAMNLRSRLTGICTGDQAIFVSINAWRAVGGFPAQPLMEDVEISRRLRRSFGAPVALRERVLVSARRWQRAGAWRTIVLMTVLRSLYALGVSPARLHRLYYGDGAVAR